MDTVRAPGDLPVSSPADRDQAADRFFQSARQQSANRQIAEAIESLRAALRLKPDWQDALIGLGILLLSAGQVVESIDHLRRAVALYPVNVEARLQLGRSLKAHRQMPEALAEFQAGIAIDAGLPILHHSLATIQLEIGQFVDAERAARNTLKLSANLPEAWFTLGNALSGQGRMREAMDAFADAIVRRPNYAQAFHNLGNAQADCGDREGAIHSFRQAIEFAPHLVRSYINLAAILQADGKLDEAMELLHSAEVVDPNFHLTLSNLGNVLKDSGQIEKAIDTYRQALRSKPDDAKTHSNLVYSLYFDPRATEAAVHREAVTWNGRHAANLQTITPPHLPFDGKNRRLRIGYVGAFFRDHCQSLFTHSLLANHDRSSFELFCYADGRTVDAVTARLQEYVDHWRDITRLSDVTVATLIARDRLDILIDLTMHMGGGRPLAMARKPAPIQAAWLAYPGTTGISAIDYRLTDPHLESANSSRFSAEQPYALPSTFWCYDPHAGHTPGDEIQPGPLPAERNGYLTFGSLNNFCKVNDDVLALWAKTLAAVPNSRLILLAGEGQHRQTTIDRFESLGVDGSRIAFVRHRPREEYLKLYQQIDITLDTFPYNGHTTSLDSFWMGVPVVTLVGQTIVGRAGLSQLNNIQLPELIAQDSESYFRIATGLATGREQLADLRSTLRSKMRASPLMDGAAFARGMEEFFRFAITKSIAS